MFSPKEIAELIEKLVKSKKTTVRQMLADCEINNNMVYSLKIGQMPSADKLVKIANYLNVDINYLMGNIDDEDTLDEEKPEPGEPGSGMACRTAAAVLNKKIRSDDPEREALIAEAIRKVMEIKDINRLKQLSDFSDFFGRAAE